MVTNSLVPFDNIRYRYYDNEGENDNINTRRVGMYNNIINTDFDGILFAIGNGLRVDCLEICNNTTNSEITFARTFKI